MIAGSSSPMVVGALKWTALIIVMIINVSCLQLEEELVLFADGSGKITLTMAVSVTEDESDVVLVYAPPGANPHRFQLDAMRRIFGGCGAITRPVITENNGTCVITCTGYFDDISQVRIQYPRKPDMDIPLFTYRLEAKGSESILSISNHILKRLHGQDYLARMLASIDDRENLSPSNEWLSGLTMDEKYTVPGHINDAAGVVMLDPKSAEMFTRYLPGSGPTGCDLQISDRNIRFVSAAAEKMEAEVAAFRIEYDKVKKAWIEHQKELDMLAQAYDRRVVEAERREELDRWALEIDRVSYSMVNSQNAEEQNQEQEEWDQFVWPFDDEDDTSDTAQDDIACPDTDAQNSAAISRPSSRTDDEPRDNSGPDRKEVGWDIRRALIRKVLKLWF